MLMYPGFVCVSVCEYVWQRTVVWVWVWVWVWFGSGGVGPEGRAQLTLFSSVHIPTT